MGRLTNLLIALAAAGTVYVSFKPQIDALWRQVVIKATGLMGPQVAKIVLTAPATFQGSSISIAIQTLDAQGNAIGNIPVSLLATPASADPLLSPGNPTTDQNGKATFTLQTQLNDFSGPIVVVGSNGNISSNQLTVTFPGKSTGTGSGSTNTPGSTPTPPTPPPPVILQSNLAVSPSTITDGQIARVSWQLSGGSDQFSGTLDTGNGKTSLTNTDIMRGYMDIQYNVGNDSQKTLSPTLTITDQVTKFVYTAIGSIIINPLPPPPPVPGVIPVQIIIYNQPKPGFWSVDIIYSNGTAKPYVSLSTQNVQNIIDQGASVEDVSGQWGTQPIIPQTQVVLQFAGTISSPPDLETDVNIQNNASTPNIMDIKVQIIDQAGNTVGLPSISNVTFNPGEELTLRLNTQLASTVKKGDSLTIKAYALASGTLSQVATPISEQITA